MDKNEVREKLNKKMDDLKEKLSDRYDRMAENVEMRRIKTQRYVRDNPEKALAITFGAGLMVGIFLVKMIRRRH